MDRDRGAVIARFAFDCRAVIDGMPRLLPTRRGFHIMPGGGGSFVVRDPRLMSDDAFKFQVDLRGIIRVLSESLYSSPQVFVRELLQNATDAIAARRMLGEPF